MKLTEIEKKEMLEDSKNLERREAFRQLRRCRKKISFEEYISLLRKFQTIGMDKPTRTFVQYQQVKL